MREIAVILEGAGERIERERQLAGWAAWTAASLTAYAFHAPKKFPRLDTVIGKKRGRRQTPKEQANMLRVLHAAFGGTLKVKGRLVEK